MAATGGCIFEWSYRGRTFKGTADSQPKIESMGGTSNEILINGDQSARRKQTVEPWHISGVKVEIDHNNGDLEFLQAGVESDEWADVSLELTTGKIWIAEKGGEIEGKLPNDLSEATAEFELKGPGKIVIK
jgi:hypothetical protein